MTESDPIKYFYGIRMRMQGDLYEFVVHGKVTNPKDGSRHIYIAKMALINPEHLYNILDKFTPTRIYICYKTDDDCKAIEGIRQRFADKTVIRQYEEQRVDQTDIINTAGMLFSNIKEKRKFMENYTITGKRIRFVQKMDELAKAKYSIKEDKDHKWISINDDKIPIVKSEPYPRMILCWALSLLAVNDDAESWDEQTELDYDEWKSRYTS